MLKNFKYIHNIADGVAEIRIYKRIGCTFMEDGINGSDFANEMAYLAQNSKKINVRINSGGGSVIDSYAIVSSILNSPVPCDTYIDGIAASAAASIAVAGRKCYMVDYGIFMIHNAIDTTDKSEQAILDVFNSSINTILTNRTKKTSEEIANMMNAETWMDAKGCLEAGMIDNIISTEKKVKVSASASLAEKLQIYNELLTNKPNMKNIIAAVKLSGDVSETEIVKAIESKDTLIASLEAKISAFEAEKTAAIEAAKTALVAKATTLVNKAVADKKITEDEKVNVIANASQSDASYEVVANMISKISNVKTASKIWDSSKVENKGQLEDRSSWTYNDWEKKDPNGLRNLYIENNAEYQELFKTYNTKK